MCELFEFRATMRFLCVLFLFCSWTGRLHAETHPLEPRGSSFYEISVLGCRIPVPNDYEVRFFVGSSSLRLSKEYGTGQVLIAPYEDHTSSSRYAVSNIRTLGLITTYSIRLRNVDAPVDGVELKVISNASRKEMIVLSGLATSLLDGMIEHCQETLESKRSRGERSRGHP